MNQCVNRSPGGATQLFTDFLNGKASVKKQDVESEFFVKNV